MQLGEELRYLILAVQREGNRQLTDTLRPFNLTPAQAEVIQVLQQFQPMTLLALGERLVCESGSPSRLVKSMVEAGWVQKLDNPSDGRAVLLRLTPAAQAIVPTLSEVEQRFNEAVESMASREMLRQLLDNLWTFAENTHSGEALKRRKENR